MTGTTIAGGHAAVVSATSAPVATTARHQRRGVLSGRYPPTRSRLERIKGASA